MGVTDFFIDFPYYIACRKKRAMQARTIAEAIKAYVVSPNYRSYMSPAQICQNITIEYERVAPDIARAIANSIIANGESPTDSQLAQQTGQPSYFCRFMLMQSETEILRLVTNAEQGCTTDQMLFTTSTEEVTKQVWVDDGTPSFRSLMEESCYMNSGGSSGHYETVTSTVTTKEPLFDVTFDVCGIEKLMTEHFAEITENNRVTISPQLLDLLIEKHFPL